MKCLILFLVAMVLTGCNDEPTINTQELDRERRRRVEAEQRATENEQSRDRWQTFTFFVGAGAVVLLFVGAALGSKARNDVGRD